MIRRASGLLRLVRIYPDSPEKNGQHLASQGLNICCDLLIGLN